ncbi:hypothetical protein DL93DRAFT_2089123 [Clavulina sp. PMI_390]|nr:hypothetical protein DL93DRAFT_2089123 [Clavulina sp. PMI_390]
MTEWNVVVDLPRIIILCRNLDAEPREIIRILVLYKAYKQVEPWGLKLQAPPSSSPRHSFLTMVSTVFRASLAILAFIVPALAVPAARSGMVVTPVGLRSASEVHEVPAGGSIKHVGNETHLINAAGKVIHIAQNTAPAPTSKRFETGWTAYTSWYNTESNGPINNFVTSWTVPPAPQTNNGQTVFLFNSIEPAAFNAILQPVLQCFFRKYSNKFFSFLHSTSYILPRPRTTRKNSSKQPLPNMFASLFCSSGPQYSTFQQLAPEFSWITSSSLCYLYLWPCDEFLGSSLNNFEAL